MKKILAIALAVVMVLSMASAFAASFDWSWPCPVSTDANGKATLKLIPYVKINTGCNTWKWVQSDCAAAVGTEDIFFVVELTVPADINPIWWKHIDGVTFTFAKGGFGISSKTTLKYTIEMPDLDGAANDLKDTEEDGYVFYAVADDAVTGGDAAYVVTDDEGNWKWTDDQSKDLPGAEVDVPAGVMNKLEVLDATKASITVAMTSNFDGMGEWLTYGAYQVYVERDAADVTLPAAITIIDSCVDSKVDDGWEAATMADDPAVATEDSEFDDVVDAAETRFARVEIENGKVATITTQYGTNKCVGDFAAPARQYFGLDLGTCVTAKNIKSNFGWKDVVSFPFTWSGNATAIVDVQCEVEIPKTGDVSVIAYAVMAVVAAAGAMGLKK